MLIYQDIRPRVLPEIYASWPGEVRWKFALRVPLTCVTTCTTKKKKNMLYTYSNRISDNIRIQETTLFSVLGSRYWL